MKTLRVDNPFDASVACELPVQSGEDALAALERAAKAQRAVAAAPVSERVRWIAGFCDAAQAMKDEVARDITRMMGKPLKQAQGEVDTMIDRARHMASIAEETLRDEPLPPKAGFERFFAREPLGVVLNVAPWNYPLLTAVNVIVPAVLAGNSVIVKHASRTPLCGAHFQRAFEKSGAPAHAVAALVCGHDVVASLIARPEVGHVAFTGSVPGGHQLYGEAAKRFIGANLELGGKDPGYVAEDADFGHAVENLVDGAFYNAGQSCCGIERIYVHHKLYDRFVEEAVKLVRAYRMGDPMDPATTMGPMATPEAPPFLARQIEEARAKGGRVLCGGGPTSVSGKGRFFEPTVVAEATHAMSMMVEESFGPIVGIAPVKDDEEALRLMNDSPYGLTAAIWTSSKERAISLGRRLATGTVFMNRCDYLDPALPWVGVKDSGLGASLGKVGLLALTRPKSFHLRLATR